MIMSMRRVTMCVGTCLMGLSLSLHAGDMTNKEKMMDKAHSMETEKMMKK
ncbi:MAG: hypothetical protein GY814_15085, partial [Gammaproteobacteria bacterium]|nr:hypothetical protein [Gammaproteobacteria bacterium]